MQVKTNQQYWADAYKNLEESYTRFCQSEQGQAHGGWQAASKTALAICLFDYALISRFAETDVVLATEYFQAAIETAQREFTGISDWDVKYPDTKDLRKSRRSELLRIEAYASAVRVGSLDRGKLHLAANHIPDSWKDGPRGYLAMESEDRLTALRLAILSEDPLLIKSIVKSARQTVRAHPGFRLMIELSTLLTKPAGAHDPTLQDRFTEYFHQTRQPNRSSTVKLKQVEVAALFHRFFLSSNGQIDWESVLDSIA